MAGRWARLPAISAAMLAAPLLLGSCYSLKPVTGPLPDPGSTVALDMNDAGRAALGTLIGPGVKRIEGKVLDSQEDSLLLGVSSITLLDGGYQVWNGEEVRLQKGHVSSVYSRQLSMGRSIGLGVAVVGGFTAFLVTRSLLGAGQGSNNNPSDSAEAYVGRF